MSVFFFGAVENGRFSFSLNGQAFEPLDLPLAFFRRNGGVVVRL